MAEGWIKIHRKLLDWEWWDDPVMVKVWLQFLFDANYEPKNWKGVLIDRGQLVFGRKAYAERCCISERQIRTVVERLKSTGELTIHTTNRFSIITVTKYDLYNQNDDEATSQTTSHASGKRPTNDQQTTTPKEVKKLRNKERVYTPEKIEVAPLVLMTPDELQKMKDEHGDEATDWMVHRLSDYKQSSGKKYKSDSAAIRTWVVSAWADEQKRRPKSEPLPAWLMKGAVIPSDTK